jgi:hypothetical protein
MTVAPRIDALLERNTIRTNNIIKEMVKWG